VTFFTYRLFVWPFVLFKIFINIIYFVMIYSIIRDTLIMIYLFYYLHKKMNKTNGQTRSLKVKNDTFNGTEGVYGYMLLYAGFCVILTCYLFFLCRCSMRPSNFLLLSSYKLWISGYTLPIGTVKHISLVVPFSYILFVFIWSITF